MTHYTSDEIKALNDTRATIIAEIEFYLKRFPNNEALKDLILDAKSEELQDYDGESTRAINDYRRLAHNLAYPETVDREDAINWYDFV